MQGKDQARITHLDTARVVLLYAVFAGMWILLSDEVINWLFTGLVWHQLAQSFKGLVFVGITSALLYLLLNRRLWPQDASASLRLQGSLVNWPAWQLYLLATALPLMTLLVRNDLAPLFDERPLMILFMLPILLSAIVGGLGPGMFATLLSAALLGMSFFGTQPLLEQGLRAEEGAGRG